MLMMPVDRGSCLRCSIRKGVLRNFRKVQWKKSVPEPLFK